MSKSKDEVIDLTELRSLSSSEKSTKVRSNEISTPSHSSKSDKQIENTTNLFQVKPRKSRNLPPVPVPRTKPKLLRNLPQGNNNSSTDTIESAIAKQNEEDTPTSLPQTTKTLQPYKEKIKNRFHEIKMKAGTSTHRAFKQSSDRTIMERIRRESKDTDTEIRSARTKFNLDENKLFRDKAYNFFCETGSPDQGGGSDEDTGIKSSENLVENLDETGYKPAVQLKSEIERNENEVLFFAKGKPVDINNKISNDQRFLENEGFYVCEGPSIPKRHLNVIEERLLSFDDKKWFNCDGSLNVLETPDTKTTLRPQIQLAKKREVSSYVPAQIPNEECNEVLVLSENVLNLQIFNLKFNHHPLFSLEHVFEKLLTNYHDSYQEYKENNHVQRILNRLEALRHVKNNLRDTMNQSGDNFAESDKLNAYNKDLRVLRELLFEEGRKERNLLKKVLETWKALKKVRSHNNYSNTSAKLTIRKEKVDYHEEKQIFDKIFHDMYADVLFEQKNEFKQRMTLYKRQLQEWKNLNKIEKSDSREEAPSKPAYEIDEENIQLNLRKKMQECLKPPGEPNVTFALTCDNEITKNTENHKENLRRNAVNSTKIYLRILCNKVEVCKLKALVLNDNFDCVFKESFSIQLTKIPKLLNIEVLEQTSSLIKKKICDINIEIPGDNKLIEHVKESRADFGKSDVIHYKHEGVGCGESLGAVIKKQDLEIDFDDFELSTKGCLVYKIGWDGTNKRTRFENVNQDLINNIVDASGVIDVGKLTEWLKFNTLDPQDPRNAILYEYANEQTQNLPSSSHQKNYFRLNPHLESVQFCDIKEIEENLRLKILQLRDQNEPEFDGMIVPNRIKEIPLNILADYKRRLITENDGYIYEDDYDKAIDGKRNYGLKYLKQVHIKVFQKCKSSQHNLTFEDVVDEKYLIHFEKLIKTITSNIINWFRWRPKISAPLPLSLNLEEKLPKTAVSATIKIKLVSAINIPQRNKTTFNESEENTNEINEVRPYVEIVHNNFVTRTATAKGTNPVWDEELKLPLESLHIDYLNPNSLNGFISVSVYDENQEELSQMKGHKSINLLGYLDIPLSAACHTNNMEGSFKIKLPFILLGYEKETDKYVTKSPKVPQETQTSTTYNTYLTLGITVQPNIPKLNPSMEELPSSELPFIREHVIKWNDDFNSSFPSRRFSALAIDTNGKTTCVVRYVRPLEPPQINVEGFDITPEQCARYVSLIPFTTCNQFYQNIWLSTDQLLKLMIGSIVDHAVTLTCYLKALKMEVWLLLGFGIPDGSTAYVLERELVRENELPQYFIYEVTTGERFSIMDPYCPLQKIYCVINELNVYGNIQRNDSLSFTRFDFTRRADWSPLFGNETTAPTNSVHNKITYSPRSETEELEIQIDRKIRKKMSKLRQLDLTTWNRNISNVFKNASYLFELNCMYGKSTAEIMSEVNGAVSQYTVYGSVVNLPYTSISTIVKKIKLFGVHFQEENATEFASAVHIHSYPNQVLTVWLFLAVIKPK